MEYEDRSEEMSDKTLGQIGYEALQAELWVDYARTDWTHPAVDRARPAWETAMQAVAAHVASPTADNHAERKLMIAMGALRAIAYVDGRAAAGDARDALEAIESVGL